MVFIKRFSDLNSKNVDIAGGKGASLGEMTQAGIAVPPGYVVLSSAFDRFVEESNLKVEIQVELDKVDTEAVHTVDFASEAIQGLIKGRAFPEDLKEEILFEFKNLNAPFVAVRSSATSEDSADAAWAGQLDSFLNTTEETLLKNVQLCWASLFTPRAIAYRFEKELHDEQISVAVVVQKMIASEVSGIAFSVHPVTQDYDQIIIEAGFGLGESIVSGQITPDSYVVDKRDWSFTDVQINEQPRELVRDVGGGNVWKELTLSEGSKQALTKDEIVELSKLTVKIEKHYGFPVDIEWAMEGGEFYIVQSRPITTLSSKKGFVYTDANLVSVANDFNSHMFRNYLWMESFEIQAKEFDIPRLMGGIASRKRKLDYCVDMDTWIRAHNKLKTYIEADRYYVEKLIDKTLKMGDVFNIWSQENIFTKDFSTFSNDELFSLYEQFRYKMKMLDAYGMILSIMDFRDFSFVEGNMKSFLESKTSSVEEFQEYYDICTYPLYNSYAQDQEEALLELMSEFYSGQWSKDILQGTVESLKTSHLDFFKKLSEHTEKYAWIYYVYAGPAFTEKEFLDFIKDNLSKNKTPQEELIEIRLKRKQIGEKREDIIKKLQPDEFNEMILRLTGKVVWAKPRRKDHQSKSYYHMQMMFKEIAKRLNISFNQARGLTPELFKEGLANGSVDSDLLDSLYDFHVILSKKEGGVLVIHGQDAQDFISTFEREETLEDVDSIKGSLACKGFAKGIVKIINEPADMHKMNKGDILVSTATTPSVVPAMKKASAIVTDEGGLTCHASIVSRELNIPCVVGTKIATKVLKDGDFVEVDADNGIVKILEKKNKKKEYTQLMHHDFPLIIAELTNQEESRRDVPWLNEPFTFHPYCVFERKNNLLYYYYNPKGIDWKIEQAGKFDKEVMKEETIKHYKKVEDIILNKPALSKEDFLDFIKNIRDAWAWWDCMWWAIEYYDKKNLPLEDLIIVRKQTEQLAPGTTGTIRNTLKKLFPEKQQFVDVISLEEVESGILPSDDVLRKRLEGFVYTDGQLQDSMEAVKEKFNIEIKEENVEGKTLLEGQTAYPGKVKGKVRCVENIDEVRQFQEDEIIVSSTTTPDFLPAMKKSVAILSEHGGAICHASITSRELKIPCIVGIKGLTRILKTGDMVEVDADNGIVKILNDASVIKWTKLGARNLSPLTWSSMMSILKEGTKINNLYFNYPKYLAIFYGEKSSVDFESTKACFDTNFKELISKKNSDVYEILIKVDDTIEKDLELLPSSKKDDLLKFSGSYKEEVGFMFSGYYLTQIALEQLKFVLGEKEFEKVKLNITIPHKLTTISKENHAINEIKEKYHKELIDDEEMKNEAKKLAESFGFIHSEYMAKEWLAENYIYEIKRPLKEEQKPITNEVPKYDDEYIDWLIDIIRRTSYMFDESKSALVRANWALRKTLTNLGFNEEKIMNLFEDEFVTWLETEILPEEDLTERAKYFALILDDGKYEEVFGKEEVDKLIQREGITEFEPFTENVNELKGTIAFKGKVIGRVKKTYTQKDADELQEGEILVASMTTPELITGMRRAAAFITDEGGLLCHAAIVSRELGVPCIIGTKIATKVLKDGDLVEVDADNGIVRILEKN